MAEKQQKLSWAELHGAPTVTISEAKEIIRLSWGDARPVALVGPPGIGKTQAMLQVAKEYREQNGIAEEDFGTVYVMMSHVDREFLTGLVYFDDDNSTTFKHMHHEQLLEQINKPHGIIIFDEFNRPRDMGILNAFFAWVTEKGANGLKINDGWTIVGAINPSTGDYMVSQVERDGAVRRRLCWLETRHQPQESLRYMTDNKERFHPEVVKFLRENSQYIFDEEALDSGKIGPTPASWEDVSRKIFNNEALQKPLDRGLLEMALAGHVGTAVASQFMAVYERRLKNENLPTVFDVLRNYADDTKMQKTIRKLINKGAIQTKETSEDEKAEGGDSKGWILHFLSGLVNTVGTTPSGDLFEELSADPHFREKCEALDFEIEFDADGKVVVPEDEFDEAIQMAEILAPRLVPFLKELTPDLFATYLSSTTELSNNDSAARLRIVQLGVVCQNQPGYVALTSRNRKIVEEKSE